MGGGVIRAAAKVAGFSLPSGGIRGVALPSATRRAATLRPGTSTVDEMKIVASNSEGTVQRPSSVVDDWVVFANEGENAADSMPRVVFGGVPSLQEAKEATSELSAALENTYLSSPTSAESDCSSAEYASGNEQNNVGRELASSSAVPSSPAIMAFKFLKESTVAQNVVASIACDPNVWNAVLQNEELQGFLQSHRTSYTSSDVKLTTKLVEDSKVFDESSAEGTNNSAEDGNFSDDGKSGHAGRFKDVLEKIKGAVANMMTGLSDFFVNLFGGKGTNAVSANSDGASTFSANNVMEASFFGLAIMAILVILLKRA